MIEKKLRNFLLTRHDRRHTTRPTPIQEEWISVGKGLEMREFPTRRAQQHRDTDVRAKWHCGTPMKEVIVATRLVNEMTVRLQKPDTFICSVCDCRIPMKATKIAKGRLLAAELAYLFLGKKLLSL